MTDKQQTISNSVESVKPPPTASPDDPVVDAALDQIEELLHEAEACDSVDSTTSPSLVDHFIDLKDESDVPQRYLAIFIDEAELSLDTLTETLVHVEGSTSSKDIESLLVTSHMIKGSAASVGLARGAKLAHFMEDILHRLRDTGEPLTSELVDALLRCTDGLRTYIHGLKAGVPESANFQELAMELMSADKTAGKHCEDTETTEAPNESAFHETSSNDTEPSDQPLESYRENLAGAGGFVGRIHFEENLPLVGLKAQLLYEKVASLGTIKHFKPSQEELQDLEQLTCLTFALATGDDESHIRPQLQISGVASIDLLPVGSAPEPVAAAVDTPVSVPGELATDQETTLPSMPSPPQSSRNEQRAPVAKAAPETIRVDIDRLDELMNLAGQLVISKARMSQVTEEVKSLATTKHTRHALRNASGSLNKILASVDPETDDARGGRLSLDSIRSHAERMRQELDQRVDRSCPSPRPCDWQHSKRDHGHPHDSHRPLVQSVQSRDS